MEPSDGRNGRFGRIAFGLLLTALWVFLAVSLAGYSPRDPASGLIFPADEKAEGLNPCGTPGGIVSAFLFDFCGVGAWFLLLVLFLRLISYWRGTRIDAPLLKTVGVFLMLAAISTAALFLWPDVDVGTLYGPGGRLGACGGELLSGFFARIGALIFLMSLLIAGAILACDGSFLRLLLWVTGLRPLSELILAPFRKKSPTDDDTPPKPLPEEIKKKLAPQDNLTAGSNISAEPPEEEETSEEESGEEYSEEELEEEYEEESDDEYLVDTDNEEKLEMEKVRHRAYELPPIDLLEVNEPPDMELASQRASSQAKRLEQAFADFGFEVRVVDMQTGPVLTLYEIELAKGLRLTKIRAIADDLRAALKMQSVRIVSAIPGKNTVGVEIPNFDRQMVRLRDVMEEGSEQADKMQIPVFLGKDVAGVPLVIDLTKLPHLLIAGRTGTGKSVCLNAIILSILMTRKPDEVQLIMIDPKQVELLPYRSAPHLMHPVIIDMKKAEAVLGWAVAKMEERYTLLARAGARNLLEYNRFTPEQLRRRIAPESDEEWARIPRQMPYMVIIADEMSDLMMVAGKDVEQHIIRLAQKSRAVGIHLVLATQKPTVDVITGLIKSNLPARIAFGVASRIDSQVVLDCNGAEQLLGNGDMLFLLPGTSQVIRGQGTYVSGDEVESVISEIAIDQPNSISELQDLFDDTSPSKAAELLRNRDAKYNEAVEYIIQEGRGSTSLLQRRFGIGYGRAARIIDTMAVEGVVGPYNGSQAREVIMTLSQWHELNGLDENGKPISNPVPKFTPIAKRIPSRPEKPEEPERKGKPEELGESDPPDDDGAEYIEEIEYEYIDEDDEPSDALNGEESAEEPEEEPFGKEADDEEEEPFAEESGDSEEELFDNESGDGKEELFADESGDSEEELFDDESGDGKEELFAKEPDDGEKPSAEEFLPVHNPMNLREMAKQRRKKKKKKKKKRS